MAKARKFALWVALLVLLIAGASGLYIRAHDTALPVPSYALASVERGELMLSVSATGTLSPLVSVQVGSQVSGIIQKINADFNSQVKKGEVIAQIEPSLFKAQVAQAQANFDSAVAAQEKAWVAVRDADSQLARTKQLLARNMIAESEADTARFRYEAAIVEHKVKKAAVAHARAVLDYARVNLAHTTIYAPIDGVVLSRSVDVGQTVAASLQAPTLFTIAQDLRRMQIDTKVDESFIGEIREGQEVSFTVFAYPNQVFAGKVAQIRLSPQAQSEVVLYNCIIDVDNSELKLKPGMTASVTIEVSHRQDVLKVPNAALRYIPDLPPEQLKALQKQLHVKKNEALIWTLVEDELKPVKVRLGLSSDRETEIHAEGLAQGTSVVVPGGRKAAARQGKTSVRLF